MSTETKTDLAPEFRMATDAWTSMLSPVLLQGGNTLSQLEEGNLHFLRSLAPFALEADFGDTPKGQDLRFSSRSVRRYPSLVADWLSLPLLLSEEGVVARLASYAQPPSALRPRKGATARGAQQGPRPTSLLPDLLQSGPEGMADAAPTSRSIDSLLEPQFQETGWEDPLSLLLEGGYSETGASDGASPFSSYDASFAALPLLKSPVLEATESFTPVASMAAGGKRGEAQRSRAPLEPARGTAPRGQAPAGLLPADGTTAPLATAPETAQSAPALGGMSAPSASLPIVVPDFAYPVGPARWVPGGQIPLAETAASDLFSSGFGPLMRQEPGLAPEALLPAIRQVTTYRDSDLETRGDEGVDTSVAPMPRASSAPSPGSMALLRSDAEALASTETQAVLPGGTRPAGSREERNAGSTSRSESVVVGLEAASRPLEGPTREVLLPEAPPVAWAEKARPSVVLTLPFLPIEAMVSSLPREGAPGRAAPLSTALPISPIAWEPTQLPSLQPRSVLEPEAARTDAADARARFEPVSADALTVASSAEKSPRGQEPRTQGQRSQAAETLPTVGLNTGFRLDAPSYALLSPAGMGYSEVDAFFAQPALATAGTFLPSSRAMDLPVLLSPAPSIPDGDVSAQDRSASSRQAPRQEDTGFSSSSALATGASTPTSSRAAPSDAHRLEAASDAPVDRVPGETVALAKEPLAQGLSAGAASLERAESATTSSSVVSTESARPVSLEAFTELLHAPAETILPLSQLEQRRVGMASAAQPSFQGDLPQVPAHPSLAAPVSAAAPDLAPVRLEATPARSADLATVLLTASPKLEEPAQEAPSTGQGRRASPRLEAAPSSPGELPRRVLEGRPLETLEALEKLEAPRAVLPDQGVSGIHLPNGLLAMLLEEVPTRNAVLRPEDSETSSYRLTPPPIEPSFPREAQRLSAVDRFAPGSLEAEMPAAHSDTSQGAPARRSERDAPTSLLTALEATPFLRTSTDESLLSSLEQTLEVAQDEGAIRSALRPTPTLSDAPLLTSALLTSDAPAESSSEADPRARITSQQEDRSSRLTTPALEALASTDASRWGAPASLEGEASRPHPAQEAPLTSSVSASSVSTSSVSTSSVSTSSVSTSSDSTSSVSTPSVSTSSVSIPSFSTQSVTEALEARGAGPAPLEPASASGPQSARRLVAESADQPKNELLEATETAPLPVVSLSREPVSEIALARRGLGSLLRRTFAEAVEPEAISTARGARADIPLISTRPIRRIEETFRTLAQPPAAEAPRIERSVGVNLEVQTPTSELLSLPAVRSLLVAQERPEPPLEALPADRAFGARPITPLLRAQAQAATEPGAEDVSGSPAGQRASSRTSPTRAAQFPPAMAGFVGEDAGETIPSTQEALALESGPVPRIDARLIAVNDEPIWGGLTAVERGFAPATSLGSTALPLRDEETVLGEGQRSASADSPLEGDVLPIVAPLRLRQSDAEGVPPPWSFLTRVDQEQPEPTRASAAAASSRGASTKPVGLAGTDTSSGELAEAALASRQMPSLMRGATQGARKPLAVEEGFGLPVAGTPFVPILAQEQRPEETLPYRSVFVEAAAFQAPTSARPEARADLLAEVTAQEGPATRVRPLEALRLSERAATLLRSDVGSLESDERDGQSAVRSGWQSPKSLERPTLTQPWQRPQPESAPVEGGRRRPRAEGLFGEQVSAERATPSRAGTAGALASRPAFLASSGADASRGELAASEERSSFERSPSRELERPWLLLGDEMRMTLALEDAFPQVAEEGLDSGPVGESGFAARPLVGESQTTARRGGSLLRSARASLGGRRPTGSMTSVDLEVLRDAGGDVGRAQGVAGRMSEALERLWGGEGAGVAPRAYGQVADVTSFLAADEGRVEAGSGSSELTLEGRGEGAGERSRTYGAADAGRIDAAATLELALSPSLEEAAAPEPTGVASAAGRTRDGMRDVSVPLVVQPSGPATWASLSSALRHLDRALESADVSGSTPASMSAATTSSLGLPAVPLSLLSAEPVERDVTGHAQGVYMAPPEAAAPPPPRQEGVKSSGSDEKEARGMEMVVAEIRWRMSLHERWEKELE